MPTAASSSASSSSSSTVKILITTDNHLGFAERDPRRGDDSFTTFEEILRAARVEHDVDAMFLGGDLFHENKPSLGCLTRACSLFRKYTLGDKPIELSLLSDPAKNFPTHALPLANFQDPNINVALPVFAIHGNHDDPVGGTSALDVLATTGCINYFGHVSSLDDIVVEPVLLRKGNTHIALYGLGNVRDERLHRCFRAKKVRFVSPKPVPGVRWFSILLLHQNRGVRGFGSKAGVLDHMLAGFGLDLVIWGNEHEQLMVPQPSQGFDIIQPGSSILTSLSAQECNPKQYGILEIRETAYRLTPFTLRSVRPTVRRTVVLARDNASGRTLDAVEEFLRSVVEEMVEEAEEQVARVPDDVLAFHPNIKYPLMRLAVDFSDADSAPFPQPNLNRFGQQYMDVIANPGELLRPVRPKPVVTVGTTLRGRLGGKVGGAGGGTGVVPVIYQLNTLDIRSKVAEVFNNNAKDACTLLSEPEVSAAVYAFAEKNERDAIDDRLTELLNATPKAVWRKLNNGSEDVILKADTIVEEVMQHKQKVNDKYVRTLEMDLAASLGVAANEEDGDEDGDDGETIADKKKNCDVAGDIFDAIEPLPGAPLKASSIDRKSSALDDPFLTSNVSTFVNNAIMQHANHEQLQQHRPSGLSSRHSKIKKEGREGPYTDEEDALEELPGDGLDRRFVDDVVADIVTAAGDKRTLAEAPFARSGKRPREETNMPDVVDVDDDDDDHAYHTTRENNGCDMQALQATSVAGTASGKRGGRKTSVLASSGAGRGKGRTAAAPAAAASAMPALTMVHDAALVSHAPPAGGANSRARLSTTGGHPPSVPNPAVLQMLSKWGSQS